MLALITVTTSKPRWLPRVRGEAPNPPPIAAKGDRKGTVMTWLFTPLMTFIALGLGSGIRSPWAGLTVLFAWPFAVFGARMLRQRIEVRSEGILITSLWFDYVWRFEDIERVSIDDLNCLCLRDRAGRSALAFTCPFPPGQTQRVVHQLEAMGYSVAALEPQARWRPNAPGVLRRRMARFDGGQILVILIYAALGLTLSTAGATP